MIDWPSGPKKIQYLGWTKNGWRATHNKPRRIAANIAKLPELLGRRQT
jgi:hypothetical protein